MHKLAKGLKKKKKQKKGKKGTDEEEFEPAELERYRRDRAEAQLKLSEEQLETGTGSFASDEWKKFEALTAGVDSILKKTQGDLDRIKTTSFFQRKAPIEGKYSAPEKTAENNKNQSKKWVGFNKAGKSITEYQKDEVAERTKVVNEGEFVNISDYDDELNDSSDEDIFDTTYVDVIQNTDVKLAYIPDSPTEGKEGDDPFDTSSAEKVLRTVDKKGKKLVSLGNAVEVLAGRIEHVSNYKLQTTLKPKNQNLLLDDDIIIEAGDVETNVTNLLGTNKTLLDDDSHVLEITSEITNLTLTASVASSFVNKVFDSSKNGSKIRLDVSEFETLKESTILEKIPDLDDSEFDLNTPAAERIIIAETEDPFSAKELPSVEFQDGIVEASFEVATFANEEDPFDTTFADNIFPGKVELKFIERELDELPASTVSISLTDPAGLIRDYETGLLKHEASTTLIISLESLKNDLLASSAIDLSNLADQPIQPAENITYVDPFDTSCVKKVAPGKTELKFLEQELLDGISDIHESLEDDDFDPRKDEKPKNLVAVENQSLVEDYRTLTSKGKEINQVEKNLEGFIQSRKTSRPEILQIATSKVVAFELPTPKNRPDLLSSSKEEKVTFSKPLTPYYCQKSLKESFSFESDPDKELDPFDTSFTTKVAPRQTGLKLIGSGLLIKEISETNAAAISNQTSIGNKQFFSGYIKNESNTDRKILKRRESSFDSAIQVNTKPLTPKVETKLLEKVEILYSDPFDTSIAANILPGKAELKLLDNKLSHVSEQVRARIIPVNLVQVPVSGVIEESEINSIIREGGESNDFLCLDEKDPGDKILTPLQGNTFLTEEIDPFDTSFATVGLGKTELKLLESELISK